jgi:molybdopterin molybdotransferase
VSKGKFDFIPEVLETLKVKKEFHKVSQRPGKPFWFGTVTNNKTVFALPGNPVSTFLCFYKYIKPWITLSLGGADNPMTIILDEDFAFQPAVTYFLQVKIKFDNGKILATPVTGKGSGDFANLSQIDGFIELPLEVSDFKKGSSFRFIPFR